MNNIVIVGAGTAGTIVANRLVRQAPDGWSVSIVDPSPEHTYLPGLLFIPFGAHTEDRLSRPRADTLHPGVKWLRDGATGIDTSSQRVELANGDTVAYDILVLATGSRIRPDETPGLAGDAWGVTAHTFYTLPGAIALRRALETFEGGRIVVNVVEMPIRCPVAPLEFVFLADSYFRRRGIRDRVDLVYATPLDGAFTQPVASAVLGGTLEKKSITVEPLFATAEVDAAKRALVAYDDRRIPYDLLVSVPTHMGAEVIAASGLGDELGFVPTDRATLQVNGLEGVFAVGDAANVPASKAGSTAHFESEVVVENVLRAIAGRPLAADFDGHANCFLEVGDGKAFLIDFNYDVEPLPGRYPWPVVGPLALLRPTRLNHWGKLAFEWLYWNVLLPGRPMPVPNRMSMSGKVPPKGAMQRAA